MEAYKSSRLDCLADSVRETEMPIEFRTKTSHFDRALVNCLRPCSMPGPIYWRFSHLFEAKRQMAKSIG